MKRVTHVTRHVVIPRPGPSAPVLRALHANITPETENTQGFSGLRTARRLPPGRTVKDFDTTERADRCAGDGRTVEGGRRPVEKTGTRRAASPTSSRARVGPPCRYL